MEYGLDKLLDRAEGSPVFHMSLASKELFHSNFLAWLGSEYPTALKAIFEELLTREFSDSLPSAWTKENIRISREEQKIDLRIRIDDQIEIIVENKVKSMAYPGQLSHYSEKVLGKRNGRRQLFVLLSLLPADFFQEGQFPIEISDKVVSWHLVTYKTVHDRLQTWLSGAVVHDEYHKSLIEDYLRLVELLISLADFDVDVKASDTLAFSREKEDLVKKATRLRMGDFLKKGRYAAFGRMALEHLKEKLGQSFCFKAFGMPKETLGKSRTVSLSFGMTHSIPLFDLKIRGDGAWIFGIQIQGMSYRMCVQSIGAELPEVPLLALKDRALWFHMEHWFGNLPVYPIGLGNRETSKRFNEFGKTFRYRSIKIPHDATMGYLMEQMEAQLNHLDDVWVDANSTLEGSLPTGR